MITKFKLLLLVGVAVLSLNSAKAIIVDYTTVADGTYASVALGGTLVTGTSTVNMGALGQFRGLGITGGGSNSSVDSGEAMTINLGGLSSNVVLSYIDVDPVGNMTFSIRAFAGGVNLGTLSAPLAVTAPQDLNISTLFGGVSVSSFDIFNVSIAPPIGLQVQKVSFVPNQVPDTGTTATLLGLALLGLAAVRRKLA